MQNENKLLFFYDDTCSKCTRFANFVKKTDVFNKVESKKLSKLNNIDYPNIDINLATNEMVSINAKGQINYGFKTIVQIAKTSVLLFPLYPLLSLLSITKLGDKIYKRIALNRCSHTCKI